MYLVSLFRLILKESNCGNHKSCGYQEIESFNLFVAYSIQLVPHAD